MRIKGTYLVFQEDGTGRWTPYLYEGNLEGFLQEISKFPDDWTHWGAHEVVATTGEKINRDFFNSFVGAFRYIIAVTGGKGVGGYMRFLDSNLKVYHFDLTLLEEYEGQLSHLNFNYHTYRFPFLDYVE